WMPFLFRRWYAYAIVTLLITSLIYSAIVAGIFNNRSPARLKSIIYTFATAGAVAFACGLIFQGMLLGRIIQTDYGDIYQAYQIGPAAHIRTLFNYMGPIHLIIAFAGLLIGLISPTTRACTLFA